MRLRICICVYMYMCKETAIVKLWLDCVAVFRALEHSHVDQSIAHTFTVQARGGKIVHTRRLRSLSQSYHHSQYASHETDLSYLICKRF